MSSNTLIIIDPDVEFINRFHKKLGEEGLTDKYEIWPLAPDTTFKPHEMFQDCILKIQDIVTSKNNIAGVFVDIVINEGGGRLDSSGIELAAEIRRHYPNLPIFNITGRYLNEPEADLISAATLEDVDGVLIKSYLEGLYFSAKRFKIIFSKAAEKRRKQIQRPALSLPGGIPESLKKAYNQDSLDPRVNTQINEIGAVEFWSLLAKLLPDAEGVISYMQPGRSGAYIFRAKVKFKQDGISATAPKGWIVKVANNPELLERELHNYIKMRTTPLNRAFYPQLLKEEIIRVGSLAGIAIELEEDASSLIEAFDQLSEEDLHSVVNNISQILEQTYGDPEKKVSKVWKEFYGLDEELTLNILSTLEEHEKIIKIKAPTAYQNVFDFVQSKGSTKPSVADYEDEVDQRTIHGDFNSRNILINKNNQLVLIDFFSRGQSHIAKDIAKLERDIVFRVFDSESPNYYDWSRIDVWQNFSQLNEKGKVFSQQPFYEGEDIKLKKCIEFISNIRGALQDISPQIKEKEYLCALLYYSLLAIAHPEISIHKKVFAIMYINEILNSFNS